MRRPRKQDEIELPWGLLIIERTTLISSQSDCVYYDCGTPTLSALLLSASNPEGKAEIGALCW